MSILAITGARYYSYVRNGINTRTSSSSNTLGEQSQLRDQRSSLTSFQILKLNHETDSPVTDANKFDNICGMLSI
jgi:hypothetical protein